MDYEERKRKQRIRVIIAELGMIVSALLIVIVATLSAMGFFISSNGQIEQSGLAQIHSIPTGATVELDGTTLFSRTNLSRTMAAGQHHLKITRANYDAWEKTITMRSGVLMRLYYPRLFLQNRTPEKVLQLIQKTDDPQSLEFYVPSSSRNYIIYAQKGTTTWHLLDVRNDEIRDTELDLSKILPGVNPTSSSNDKTISSSAKPAHIFDGEILSLKWSDNDERILAQIRHSEQTYWILITLRDLSNSLNLTKTFGLDFQQIEFIDNAANQLYALENHQLRKINANDQSLSRVLLNNVETFRNYRSNIIYLANNNVNGQQVQSIGVYREEEKGATTIANFTDQHKIYIALARYYDEDYICYVVDNKPTILYGTLPSYSENISNLNNLKQLTEDMIFTAIPDSLELSSNNEYLVAKKGQQIMAIDLDNGNLYEYQAVNNQINWLDASMLYAIKDQQIIVWDFDGTNQRNLSESSQNIQNSSIIDDAKQNNKDNTTATNSTTSTEILSNYQLLITANDRWLYYLIQDNNTITLMREKIRD